MLQTNYTEDQYTSVLDDRSYDMMRETFNLMDSQGDLAVKRLDIIKEYKVK